MVEYWLATTLLARELAIILPEPIPPGDTVGLKISYQGSLNSSTARGSESDGYIGITEEKAFLRLFGYCQWLPLIHTMPNGTRDLAMFRLEANIPSDLQIVAPGVEIQEQVTNGRRVSVWNTLYPVSLTQYSVWIDSWKVHSEGDLRVYYHDNEDATKDYLNTCITILNWYKKLYSVGLPIDKLEVPYSIVQLDVPSGGYESQNMVGFARSRFLGQFSYSDLTWISHEMIPGFITVPVDENQPGSVLITDGFNLFFNLPVLEKMIGPEFKHWDLERRWKQYENGLQRGSDGEGPLPPDKPLAEITPSEYMYYKDRFLTADKEQIILWRLLEILGEEDFFAAYQDYLKEHREKPATLESFRAALEKTSGKDLEEFFYRWFYTSEKLPYEWRPVY